MLLDGTIKIDFKEFFSSGKFDVLKLGQSKEWILNNFPNPDGLLKQFDEVYKANIWTYGNIELHFSEDKLFLIFSDYIDALDGGKYLELDKWFLDDEESLKLPKVLWHLNSEHLDYCKKTNSFGETTVEIALQSGLSLGFSIDELDDESYDEYIERTKITKQNEFKLVSFSLIET